MVSFTVTWLIYSWIASSYSSVNGSVDGSCNLNVLYAIDTLQAFDLFPYTQHVEILSVLGR